MAQDLELPESLVSKCLRRLHEHDLVHYQQRRRLRIYHLAPRVSCHRDRTGIRLRILAADGRQIDVRVPEAEG